MSSKEEDYLDSLLKSVMGENASVIMEDAAKQSDDVTVKQEENPTTDATVAAPVSIEETAEEVPCHRGQLL